MHHDDSFRGREIERKREIRFILVFLLMKFMYIDDVPASFRHFFVFSLLLWVIMMSSERKEKTKGKKKKQKEKSERYPCYIRPTRHCIHSRFTDGRAGKKQDKIIGWSTRFREQILTAHLRRNSNRRADLTTVVIILTIQISTDCQKVFS